jgi:hypothetical protein
MPCCIGWGNRTWCPALIIRRQIPPRQRHSKNQLPEHLSAIQAEHPGKRIEWWFQDEARFGQQGCNSRIWGDTGSRPGAPRQTAYESLYLFGAVCPETGASNGWLMPFANTQTMQGHLDDLSRHLAVDVHAALVLDGAGSGITAWP